MCKRRRRRRRRMMCRRGRRRKRKLRRRCVGKRNGRADLDLRYSLPNTGWSEEGRGGGEVDMRHGGDDVLYCADPPRRQSLI